MRLAETENYAVCHVQAKRQGEAKSVVCTKKKRRNDLHQSGMIVYECDDKLRALRLSCFITAYFVGTVGTEYVGAAWEVGRATE